MVLFCQYFILGQKIGETLEVLEVTQQHSKILFLSDHGDMPSERGLWFKMLLYEGSARVSLMISTLEKSHGLIKTHVSAIYLSLTIRELGGVDVEILKPRTNGESLVYLGQGGLRKLPVSMEYAAEASKSPTAAFDMRIGNSTAVLWT